MLEYELQFKGDDVCLLEKNYINIDWGKLDIFLSNKIPIGSTPSKNKYLAGVINFQSNGYIFLRSTEWHELLKNLKAINQFYKENFC